MEKTSLKQSNYNIKNLNINTKNEIRVRELTIRDKKALINLVNTVHQFSNEEKQCAIELMDEYLKEGTKDYEFIAATDENNKLCGFISFGDISLTDACYDLYWIVCDPNSQGRGVGTQLLNRLEKVLHERGARKLFAETSSQDSYKQARSFYIKKGFKCIAQIPDFYKPGDDKLIYVKTLNYPVL